MNIQNKKMLKLFDWWESTEWNINLESSPRFSDRQPFWDINNYDKISTYATSDEYIKNIINNKEKPRYYSVTETFGEEPYGKFFFDKLPYEYDKYYTVIYNPRGFVGWHNDNHVSGWYILFSYNKEGNGFFKNINPKTGNIELHTDKQGWNYKAYYAGNTNETVFWHCALSNSQRFTWITQFYTEEKYNKAIEILTNK